MNVLFAAGGTGGHVFPSIAVARALVAADPSLTPVFVGTRDCLEGRLVPEAGFELHHVDVLPLPRRLSPAILKVPGALRTAIRRCHVIIEATGAQAAVTFGGYVSFPLARAASKDGLPLVVHEQNAVPGVANQIAARWADRIAVSFAASAERFAHPERCAVTGNPVREEILRSELAETRAGAVRRFRLDPRRRTLLVFGGSQGARSLNRAVVDALLLWQRPDRIQILHAAGRALHPEALRAWEQAYAGATTGPVVRCIDFIDDMASAYAAADVVVCRAGATSFAELTALGKASVLVPLPHATRDHQRHNAEALVHAGGALLIADDELNGRTLVAAAEPLLDDDTRRDEVASAARAMGRRDAADNVARLVLQQLARVGAL